MNSKINWQAVRERQRKAQAYRGARTTPTAQAVSSPLRPQAQTVSPLRQQTQRPQTVSSPQPQRPQTVSSPQPQRQDNAILGLLALLLL